MRKIWKKIGGAALAVLMMLSVAVTAGAESELEAVLTPVEETAASAREREERYSSYNDSIVLESEFVDSYWQIDSPIEIKFSLYHYSGNSWEQYQVNIYDRDLNRVAYKTDYIPTDASVTLLTLNWNECPSPGKYYVEFYSTYDRTYENETFAFYVGTTSSYYDLDDDHFENVRAGYQEYITNNKARPLSAWMTTGMNYGGTNYDLCLEEMYVGDGAWEFAGLESRANYSPTSSEQWIVMKFYLQNNGGSTLYADSILSTTAFYDQYGASMPKSDTLYLNGKKAGQGVSDTILYPGESDTCWLGFIVPKSSGYPFLKADVNSSGSACWLNTDPFEGLNGWSMDRGEPFYFENGQKVRNRWVQDAAGWLYLGDNARPVMETWMEDAGGWLYLDSTGYMVTDGWAYDSAGACYMGSDGHMVTNAWVQDEYGWCYVGGDGRVLYNCWLQDNSGWCYVGGDGYVLTNCWLEDNSGWCYVGDDGHVFTNSWVEDSAGWCYVDDDGHVLYNCWLQDSTGWCYVGGDGHVLYNCWLEDNSGWCFVGGDGHVLYNCWLEDNTGWCFVGGDGHVLTNCWLQDNSGWCYVGGDGHLLTQCWVADSQGWCYLDAAGHMASNCWAQDSQGWCYLDGTGHAMTDAWVSDSQGWCYLDGSGRMAKNAWVADSQGWCYLDENGYMLCDGYAWDSTGEHYLDASGHMVW